MHFNIVIFRVIDDTNVMEIASLLPTEIPTGF